MNKPIIFIAGDSPALTHAARFLEATGIQISRENATHTLLNVPSCPMEIPPNVTVIGGNLTWLPPELPRLDLLQDEIYVAENAHLTADCTLRLLAQQLGCAFRGCPVLIIGWGRIGKCLAAMLAALEATVAVAARKPSDLAMLRALGYEAVAMEKIQPARYRAIVNTAPAPILTAGEGFYIDLASQRGITGENVLWARGLPGKMIPESSGKLIASAILRLLMEEKV